MSEKNDTDVNEIPEFLVKHGHRIALALASLLVFYWFWPELHWSSIFYNDGVSHSAIIRGMDQAWQRGGNITDFWMGYINFGHALLRSYQFLFHLTVWLVHKTVLSPLRLELCFNICITLMAMAVPWAFYKGARLLGLRRLEATLAAIALVFVHERDGYGIGLTNYTYSGYGLYNQLFSMLFFPLCIGYAHRMLRTGQHFLAASLAFSATFMSHILMGYFACMWIGIDLLFVLATERRVATLKRVALAFAKFGGLVLLWTGHWVLPMAQDVPLQHKSEFEAPWKWTGHGFDKMANDYVSGLILDADRFPVLTLLSALAVLFCVVSWAYLRRRKADGADRTRYQLRLLLALQAVLWVLLSFGPKTWGPVLTLLPFAGTLHWHRVFAGAQIAMILCVGIMLGEGLRRLDLRGNRLHVGLAAAVLTTVLVPCLIERHTYFYKTNEYWLKDTYSQWEEQNTGYQEALNFALAHSDARYFVGHPFVERKEGYGNNLKLSQTIPWYALLVQFNIEDVGAIHHHQNHTEVLAFKSSPLNPTQAELMNIRYVGLPNTWAQPLGFTKLLETRNGVLYDNGNTSGYFGIGRDVGPDVGCADSEALSRSVAYFLSSHLVEDHVYVPMRMSGNCDGKPGIEALLTSTESHVIPGPLPGKVLSSTKDPGPNSDIFSAKVRMTAPGLVLFKMNYHPGWKATVDGQPTDTMMVVPSFTALRVGPGEHEVRLEYKVAPFKRALLWLSLVALAALGAWYARRVALALRDWRSKHKASAA